jgi:hypothetical protein
MNARDQEATIRRIVREELRKKTGWANLIPHQK